MISRRSLGFCLLGLMALAGCSRSTDASSSARLTAAPTHIDFNRDIRPILNQHCIGCHGGVKESGGISFVFREGATRAGQSGRRTIVPGQPNQSELIKRITSLDEEFRMPKPEHGPRLPDAQIALFRQWISEGAEWAEHWAFIAPKSQPVPATKNTAWARSPLDTFVLQRLEQEGLAPSAPADKSALLRRVSFDLIGLPPTMAEQDAFLADNAPGAYERQVDRLLASPRYGERWASLWLDLARYADSKGYEKDLQRSMWPYRDWLIDSLNRNLPYDQFVTAQLAGDLLPDAPPDALLATAFQRNTQNNDEGGADEEEYRTLAVQDRVATTWVALNGITMNCVQCHSHPYDPIRQREYYTSLALFNTTRDGDFTDDYPFTLLPNDQTRRSEVRGLEKELAQLRHETTATHQTLEAETQAWSLLAFAAAAAQPAPVKFEFHDGEAFALDTVRSDAIYELTTVPVTGEIRALRLEAPPKNPDKARHTPEAGFIVTRVDAWKVSPEGREEPVDFGLYATDLENPAAEPANKPESGPADEEDKHPEEEVHASSFGANPALNGTRWWVAVPRSPLTLPAGARLKFRLTHGRPFNTTPTPVRRLRLSFSADPRWTALAADPAYGAKRERATRIAAALKSIPGVRVPVMSELPAAERRETRLFDRGNWLEKTGEPLPADTPALFPPFPAGEPHNRLGFARWLFQPGQPLTARVAVNRCWEQLFGLGIVETPEDFGSAGLAPSHPELLDWLALHFERELHWDTKALLREIVTSATYRQSAQVSAALRDKDPRNRLLARGPRQRLTAEMIRDQALAASGLLSAKMHGPSVMPPQPAGVWATVYSKQAWTDATGEDRYRRALYTFWKRSSPYPSFLSFDAPTRDLCTVRRVPTNTPLQALVTLNDPVYHEAARALAQRMAAQGGDTPGAQIDFGFRLAASRPPAAAERAALLHLRTDTLQEFAADPGALKSLGVETAGQGALITVAEALLNLDATLNR